MSSVTTVETYDVTGQDVSKLPVIYFSEKTRYFAPSIELNEYFDSVGSTNHVDCHYEPNSIKLLYLPSEGEELDFINSVISKYNGTLKMLNRKQTVVDYDLLQKRAMEKKK